jgi:hypothetical protein
MVAKIEFVVFWVVVPYSAVVVYHCNIVHNNPQNYEFYVTSVFQIPSGIYIITFSNLRLLTVFMKISSLAVLQAYIMFKILLEACY